MNGYSNWDTWALVLNINNDEYGLQRLADQCRRCYDRDELVGRLVKILQDSWVETPTGNGSQTVRTCTLCLWDSPAYHAVDFYEAASALADDILETLTIATMHNE